MKPERWKKIGRAISEFNLLCALAARASVQFIMPREIRLSTGSIVLIGKNAKDNDNLTFQLSKEGDVWFHVEDYPGSHVILRSESVTQQEIKETAAIAAYHSQARSEKKVLVMYTLIQNVKKENKIMGEVIVDEYKTINISPQKRWYRWCYHLYHFSFWQ